MYVDLSLIFKTVLIVHIYMIQHDNSISVLSGGF